MPTALPVSEVSRPAISILPDHIVDQIAAGEVVERPASVVKELVENGLDAGATHITVEVEAGGKRLIRVSDNGHGMTADELRLAIKRHATSKLRSLEDVYCLGTMGFRGEALPSIAAVSRMTVTTRSAKDQDGSQSVAATRLVVEAGKIVETTSVGAPFGTQFEVRDLLANVPARLKFMKGDATEASHVTDVVTKLAMAHPSVHFRLRHGNRTALDAPGHRNGFERARSLLGTRVGGALHPVSGDEAGVQVVAFLASPELSQTTSRGIQMFVGRRAIRDRGLLHAIRMGYGELIPKGRYPVTVLLIDTPAGSVDVNVHPQKLEVRFSDPQAVYAAVRHTIAKGVGSAPWLKSQSGGGLYGESLGLGGLDTLARQPAYEVSALAEGYAQHRTKTLLPWGTTGSKAREPKELCDGSAVLPDSQSATFDVRSEDLRFDSVSNPSPGLVDDQRSGFGRSSGIGSESTGGHDPSSDASGFFSALKYYGQLDRTYLICESQGELVLIDQHAAHERVEFERLKQRYHDQTVPVQRLLFPIKIELPNEQSTAIADYIDELKQVGFELEPFGGNTIAVKAVPAGLIVEQVEVVFRELIDELINSGGSRAVEERLESVLATIACHSVVRAGDELSREEVKALFNSLDGVEFRTHCPHGRPVQWRIPIGEIARRLGRT